MKRPLTCAMLEAALAGALRDLRTLQREGMLPRRLEPLALLAPEPGATVRVELRRRRDGVPASRGERERIWRQDEEWGVFISWSGEARVEERMVDPEACLRDLVRVQDEAERREDLRFVALKFLRDRLLPAQAPDWAHSPQACQQVVRLAIERGLLTRSKIDNPRSPEHRVTAVALDRSHPMVRALVPPLDRAEIG